MAKPVEPEDLAAYSFLSEPSFSPDGSFAALSVHRALLDKDEYEGNLWIVPTAGGEPRQLTTAGKDSAPKVSPDGKRVLFTSKREIGKDDKGNALYMIPTDGGEARLLLRRKEGIEGVAWSPDGRRGLFLSNVGEDEEDVRTIRRINFWFNDKGFIYNVRKHIFQFDLERQGAKQLPFIGNDFPRGFASHNHLWLIGASGGSPTRLDDLDRSLQNGLNSDVRLGGVNSDPKWVGDRIYHLVAEGGSVHLRAQRVRDRKAETIVGGNRSVEAFQVNAKGIVFTAMEMAVPAELYTMDRGVRQLTEFNGETRKKLAIRKPEAFTFKASDGATIDAWILGPAKKGKVPTILYVHGGPKTAFGNSYLHEFQVFAAKGYAVLFTNPRGSDGYSEDFADIRSHYGERDYLDLMEAVDFASSKYPFVDSKRLAVA